MTESGIEHAAGELRIPDGVGVYMGSPNGGRRSVGIVVGRFNGDITSRLLDGALDALAEAGVTRDRVDVMPVPGAFELPLGAMAFAKTRRYSCVIALGTLTEKRNCRGTESAQRAYVCCRCGRWKEELISTTSKRVA